MKYPLVYFAMFLLTGCSDGFSEKDFVKAKPMITDVSQKTISWSLSIQNSSSDRVCLVFDPQRIIIEGADGGQRLLRNDELISDVESDGDPLTHPAMLEELPIIEILPGEKISIPAQTDLQEYGIIGLQARHSRKRYQMSTFVDVFNCKILRNKRMISQIDLARSQDKNIMGYLGTIPSISSDKFEI